MIDTTKNVLLSIADWEKALQDFGNSDWLEDSPLGRGLMWLGSLFGDQGTGSVNAQIPGALPGTPYVPGSIPGVGGGGTPGYNPLNPSGVYGVPVTGGPGQSFGTPWMLPPLGPTPAVTPNLQDTGRTPSGPQSRQTAALIEQLFGSQLRGPIGGSRDNNTAPGTHDAGLSIDIPIGPDQGALGDQINAWLQAHAQELGLKYSIWRDRGQYPGGGGFNQPGHTDHIDAHFNGAASQSSGGGGGGGVPLMQNADGTWTSPNPAWAQLIKRESGGINQRQKITDVNSGGNEAEGLFQITPATWRSHGGTKYAPSAISATPQQQAEIAAEIFRSNPSGSDWGAGLPGRENASALAAGLGPSNALTSSPFGPSYQSGPLGGTPGFNDQGDPGTYVPDPRQIAMADRRVTDTTEQIADANQAILDAKERQIEATQKVADLENDVLATEEEKKAARDQLKRANDDTTRATKQRDRAMEDLGYANQDADEARKGSFKPDKKTSRSGKTGGAGGLDPIGGILGSFLKETFGVDGSFLPDISNLMPVQMGGALLNAFGGPLQGLIDGGLGIMQPGWQPGMPVNGVQNDTGLGYTGGGGGGGGFGLPDVVPPPMSPDAGTGQLPGPPTAPGGPNIDMSVHYNGDVGMDPATIQKQQLRQQDRGMARLGSFAMGIK
jgi:hypothetical protein